MSWHDAEKVPNTTFARWKTNSMNYPMMVIGGRMVTSLALRHEPTYINLPFFVPGRDLASWHFRPCEALVDLLYQAVGASHCGSSLRRCGGLAHPWFQREHRYIESLEAAKLILGTMAYSRAITNNQTQRRHTYVILCVYSCTSIVNSSRYVHVAPVVWKTSLTLRCCRRLVSRSDTHTYTYIAYYALVDICIVVWLVVLNIFYFPSIYK